MIIQHTHTLLSYERNSACDIPVCTYLYICMVCTYVCFYEFRILIKWCLTLYCYERWSHYRVVILKPVTRWIISRISYRYIHNKYDKINVYTCVCVWSRHTYIHVVYNSMNVWTQYIQFVKIYKYIAIWLLRYICNRQHL